MLGLGDGAGGGEGGGGGGEGGGGKLIGATAWMAKNVMILYHLRGIVHYSSRFDLGVVYKSIFRCCIQCVIALWCVILHGSQDRTFLSIGATI